MKKQHPWLTPLLWVWYLYADGFKKMTLGRKLWAIILIKLVILFALFKHLVYPDDFSKRFPTDESRSGYLYEQLTKEHP